MDGCIYKVGAPIWGEDEVKSLQSGHRILFAIVSQSGQMADMKEYLTSDPSLHNYIRRNS